MKGNISSQDLLHRTSTGEIAAMARLMSRAESDRPEVRRALAEIYRQCGNAHVIGITGVPGSGKSTLVASLTRYMRSAGSKVAIVAIDPSSSLSGGSILGDRIRMSDVANDPGVFIRSMATRGFLGGIARATLDIVDILDFAGFDIIIVETVGVGQDEVDIVNASATTVVVSAPGLGDEIQAIKAGILEIADIHVVAKADRSDAKRTIADLKQMLMLGTLSEKGHIWSPPVLPVSSYNDEGFEALLAAIVDHRSATLNSDVGRRRRLAAADFRLRKTAEALLSQRFAQLSASLRPQLADRLYRREGDPYSLAKELIETTLSGART